MGYTNSESYSGAPMEVSEAGDKFDLQQEEVGTLEMVEFEDNVFFAQSWPSWAFALRGLECKELFELVEWENRLKSGV